MPKVTCFGSGKGVEGEKQYDAMRRVGQLLAMQGITVVTGGYGGSGMEAPVRGAKEGGGKTWGFSLKCRPQPTNPYLDWVRVTDEGPEEEQYCDRLGFLLKSDGFVVDSTDDTPGTLIEFFSVVNLNMKEIWKGAPRPVIVLNPRTPPAAIGLFEREIVDYAILIRTFPWLQIASGPEEAVAWLMARLPLPATK